MSVFTFSALGLVGYLAALVLAVLVMWKATR